MPANVAQSKAFVYTDASFTSRKCTDLLYWFVQMDRQTDRKRKRKKKLDKP